MIHAPEAPTGLPRAGELSTPYPRADRVAQGDLQGCQRLSLDLDAERADADLDRMELPPLLPGLPNTPYSHCAALICAIVWQAILERDMHWCAGPRFNFYLSLLGWDHALILDAKRRLLRQWATAQRQYAPLSGRFIPE